MKNTHKICGKVSCGIFSNEKYIPFNRNDTNYLAVYNFPSEKSPFIFSHIYTHDIQSNHSHTQTHRSRLLQFISCPTQFLSHIFIFKIVFLFRLKLNTDFSVGSNDFIFACQFPFLFLDLFFHFVPTNLLHFTNQPLGSALTKNN